MKNPFVITALAMGALTGLAVLAFTLAIHAWGLNPLGRHALLFLPVHAMGLILGFRYYRDHLNGGVLGGAQAVSLGVIANLGASVAYGLLFYAWLRWASPGILLTHQAAMRDRLLADKEIIVNNPDYGQKFLDESLAAIPKMTVGEAAWSDFKKVSGVGLVLGIAVGLFFRKKAR
jgi:hypothetical protein